MWKSAAHEVSCLPLLTLLLVLLERPGAASTSPCGAGWTYDGTVGWCLRQISLNLNWTDARAYCAGLQGPDFGSRAAGALLGAPNNLSGAAAADRFLTQLGNFGDMWVSARKVSPSGTYQWVDFNQAENVTVGWSPNPGTKDCVYMAVANIVTTAANWDTEVELVTSDCTELKPFYCYYEAKRCQLGDLAGFIPDTMDLPSQAVNIGQAAVANCRAGYYRRSQMMAAMQGTVDVASSTSIAPNSVNCTDAADSVDPELVTPVWVQGAIESCIIVGCSTDILTELGIDNALPFSDALVKKGYKFGEGFNVTCKRGYVSTTDRSSKVARVSCLQDPTMTWMGVWIPSSSDVCGPIHCIDIRTVLSNYSGVQPAKAFNQELNRWFSDLEINRFSGYSTEVYITCNSVGLFFQDQKYERQLACLVENDTSTVANWVGIRGTYSIGSVIQNIQCIEVVCNIVDIFRMIEEGGSVVTLMNSYHISEGVVVYDARSNTLTNMTRAQVSAIGSLLYGSYLSVSCPVDWLFVQSGTDQINLVLNLVQISTLCSRTGKWNQTIGMCIERTAAIQLLGRQKQYVPPTKEANAAWQMGVVTISIVIIFFTCIVVLDLATIKRDFNLLKTNLFYLRLRLTQL